MAILGTPLLSETSGGRNILVAATASTGTLIHQTDISATVYHRVYLYAMNASTSGGVLLTVEWGGTSSGDRVHMTVPSQSGPVPIIDNWPLAGTGAAVRNVRAYAAVANVLSLNGWVNRHTTS